MKTGAADQHRDSLPPVFTKCGSVRDNPEIDFEVLGGASVADMVGQQKFDDDRVRVRHFVDGPLGPEVCRSGRRTR